MKEESLVHEFNGDIVSSQNKGYYSGQDYQTQKKENNKNFSSLGEIVMSLIPKTSSDSVDMFFWYHNSQVTL